MTNPLFLCSFRLLREEVNSLEDVYWLDDDIAHALLGSEYGAWSRGRQRLPATKETLEMFKADLWGDLAQEQSSRNAKTMSYPGNNLKCSAFIIFTPQNYNINVFILQDVFCYFSQVGLYSSLYSIK